MVLATFKLLSFAMRLKVFIETEKLPIIYRHRFLALIKESLSRSNIHYKAHLYDDEVYTKKIKPFTFAVLFPKGTRCKREAFYLDLDGKHSVEDFVFYPMEGSLVNLLISSVDYEFIMYLYNGLLEIKSFPFNKDVTLSLKKILPMVERKITSDWVLFKTYSPILIERADGSPVFRNGNFPDKECNEEFNAIHDRILKDLRGYGLKKEMRFEPLSEKWKKQVVKHTLQKIKDKLGKSYATFTCFEGYFHLGGDPEDIEFLYKKGIGLRTGQGFGMVEVVRNE